MLLLCCGGNLGYILELKRGLPFKIFACSATSDSCLVVWDTSRFSSRLGRAIGMPLEVRWKIQGSFPDATWILGFLSIFQRSQASSPFETLDSACLSSFQKDVRTPVVMTRGVRAFSMVSTGDSDMTSSWEMKDEPAFKSLQGNQESFRVRASQCPFQMRRQDQGPFHRPIVERSLLLR